MVENITKQEDFSVAECPSYLLKLDLAAGRNPKIGFKSVDIVCGMDFTMIRTDIFDKLRSPPWFKSADSKSMFDPETGGVSVFTEDTFFISKVVKAGFKAAVHSGCWVGHLLARTGEVY